MPEDPNNLDPSPFELRRPSAQPDHFVEFYADDITLAASVARFIQTGIARGESALVVADQFHRAAIELELGRTLDIGSVKARGEYVALDAAETLASFMVAGAPDPERFEEVIGAAMERTSGRGDNLRVFGEMVSLLWAEGNLQGALQLEDLWNGLGAKRLFRLFCAYPATVFEHDIASFESVCNRHSHVLA